MNPVKVAHLSWVRNPIEKYIERCKQAMVSLTAVRDRINTPPNGAEPVWFANQNEKLTASKQELNDLLACIASALEVIGSAGGHSLASEARTLASVSLSDMAPAEQDKALLSIQSALQVLPSYISMVIEGAHDSPGVVLKYINDMRALRGVPALADESALPVNLTFGYKSPPLHESDCDLSERERVFKKAASQFGPMYAKALKEPGDAAWSDMRDHLRELQRVTNDPELGCYWWVGEAIIDVIIADNYYVPPAMTTALRVVMVATQRLPQGEDAAKQSLTPAKFSSLLNALSISRKKTNTSIEVVNHFDVKQNVEEDRIAQLQTQLASQSVQSITDVLPEIKPRLESAMIAFGRAVNARHAEGFGIQVQAFDNSMRTIANIFGIFDEVELSEVSFYLADSLKGVTSPQQFTPEVIETVKTQILFLDSRLINMRRNEAADHLQMECVSPDVIDKIATETTAELKKVSQMIATHVDSGVGSDKLLSALDSLRELACVYEFAGSITIANVLAAIVTVISEEVRDSILADSPKLTLAARALVSIEMYLGYINAKLQPPASLIEVATGAVREMGLDVSEFRTITHSDLLAKFEASGTEDDGLDALLREIFELRPIIEEFHKDGPSKGNAQLNQYSAACLRLNAAAMIKGEKKYADLCRHASELAKMLPGRVDDASFDHKGAAATLVRASETMLRCMDDYSAKGKVNLFLVDAIREVAILTGRTQASNDTAQTPTTVEPDTSLAPAEPAMPGDYDPELKKLFDEEFAEQLVKLRDYLNRSDLTVTEEECRAIHSIHGCSGSASCIAISTLFDVLEARFYALRGKDDALTSEQGAALRELLGSVELYQSRFPWEIGMDEVPAWLEIAGSLTGSILPVASDMAEREAEVASEAFDMGKETVSAPSGVHTEHSHDTAPELVADAETLQPAPAVAMDASLARPEPDYSLDDDELIGFFLGDADDVIPELQKNIQAWIADTSDREVTRTIKRHMHTLKGAAGIINALGIRALTHHMESLFDSMASGAIQADKNCVDLTTFVLNELITMSDAVRNRQAYRTLPALNEFVSDACELNKVDGGQLAAIIAASYGSPTVATEPLAAVEVPQALTATAEQEADSHEHAPNESTTHDKPVVDEPGAVPQPTSVSDSAESVVVKVDVTPTAVPEHAAKRVAEAEATDDSDESDEHGHTRRGYRGLRGRAVTERQRNFEKKQANKSLAAAGVVFDADFFQGEPDYTEIETPTREINPQVLSLISKASDSHRESTRVQRKANKGSEKIKVELAMLDNSVKLSNELKASSYRQTTLNRDMMLSVGALREKISLLLMHSNKTTVQLRHFNNITNTTARNAEVDKGSDEQRLYLERFNHLSHSHTQTLAQIEQLLQEANDIIAQTTIMDSAITYQAEVATSLQRDLLQSRLVMFDNEKPSLLGALGSASQLSQKKAELRIVGSDTRIDRQLLESIRDSLRHVVTNAVAHGIESEAERQKLGKPLTGVVTVKASRRAKSLVIEVTDDGRGIDPHVIRQKAIAQKLIKETDSLSEQQILHLITEPEFSTAHAVTELAGRGVGMDIVRSRISVLGGHLHISSKVGVGTTIALELPITVGSNRALVCRISGQWFAIPTFNMTQVLDYPTTELLAIKAKPGQASISYDDKTYDVVHLADLMAVPDLRRNTAQSPSHTSLVLVEQGATRLAIEVENGISMPEIHVTKFEGILSTVKGVIGSTEVHDGTPALVLDVIEMARLNLKMTEAGYKAKMYRIRRIKREAKPLVLIVDDASSYQKMLTKHFLNLGWEVASANNGQDALDKLPRMNVPSLFVVDVEMPRMNGLDLTKRLRTLKQFDNTPIIMLTTRANLEEKALELGVNKFLPKPYDRAVFNEAVRAVCPEIEEVGAA
uniref:Chemotaxis protein CheA n=1 Tax=Pseudomonas fluorescens (strain SBW25) TaxID=216595 RepID=A0A0G4E4S0_PSEFS|nr:response regulator [Pseudomonas fluorescens]CEK41998.1 hypothetical protein PQBR57_0045 [Pseudomonas fluorescens SBW25]